VYLLAFIKHMKVLQLPKVNNMAVLGQLETKICLHLHLEGKLKSQVKLCTNVLNHAQDHIPFHFQ
jgi:hypothetical protein